MCQLHTAATITNMYEDTCVLEVRPTHDFFHVYFILQLWLSFKKRRKVSEPYLVIFVNEQDIWEFIITETQMDSPWET